METKTYKVAILAPRNAPQLWENSQTKLKRLRSATKKAWQTPGSFDNYKPLPKIREITDHYVQMIFNNVKEETEEIVNAVMEMMLNDPELESRIVRKSKSK